MFFAIITIVSIVTLLAIIQFDERKDNILFRLVVSICFFFSWGMIVMWLTVLIETWQLALSTPFANSESIPTWGHIIQNFLRRAVFLFPVSRLTLGILYALPILLIPALLIAVKQSQALPTMLLSTLANLLFFWTQLIIDYWMRLSYLKIPVQGIILLMTYALTLYILIRHRSLKFGAKVVVVK